MGQCENLVFTDLTLQDPLILNMNVTRNVDNLKLKEILDLFSLISVELKSLENGPSPAPSASQKNPAPSIPVANGVTK